MLDAARAGLSNVLVFRGEAGIGKTSLLDFAVEAAPDFLVVRLVGFEAERELGFAALHRLLTPILHQIERLPPPQRDALNSALGRADGPPANPFLLGLGVMTLAGTAARARERLLVTFDDAQWIDRESMAPLAFWARRLHAEGTAVIIGERLTTDASSLLDDFPVIDLGGLDDQAARAIVQVSAGLELDHDVADRIVAETGGNPLALTEFARDLTIDQTVGVGAALQPLPISRRVEQRFASRVRSLPIETQMLLLLVAADSSGDPATIWSAASRLGVTQRAADAAEAVGLLAIDTGVVFPHPLIRSAVYSGGRPADRRAVHAALATATDAAVEPERRAWHLASAVVGADESVATLLEDCARRSSERGGDSAAVSLLTRAAELTADPVRGARNRLLAAEAALAGGAVMQAQVLVEQALPHLRADGLEAAARRIEGMTWARLGRPGLAAPKLFAAATDLRSTDPELGRQTIVEALEQSVLSSGVTEADRVLRKAIAVSALAEAPGADTAVELAIRALAIYTSDGFVEAAAHLRAILSEMSGKEVDPLVLLRWTLVVSNAARALWDRDVEAALMHRVGRASRDRGALRLVGIALQAAASAAISAGQFGEAESLISEALEVSEAAGISQVALSIIGLELAVHQGRETDARSSAAAAQAMGSAMGLGAVIDVVETAIVTLDLGLGRYEHALELARGIFERDPLPFGNTILPDLIEAAVRADDLDAARGGLDQLAERAIASGTPLALGLLARSRALVGDEPEPLFVEAIGLLESNRSMFDLARTRLLYGEWLRRQRRRTEARDQLRAAYDMFSAMGANAFAGRARAELLATGERARQRTVDLATDLTPQEANVARLAAAGETNSEIATQMFLSVSTVEYHLRKVFRKLDVTSRRDLENALPLDRLRPTQAAEPRRH